MQAATALAAALPPASLLVVRNEAYLSVLAPESITITGMPASVTLAIGSPKASKIVGEMTTAAGFEPAALSSTAICPAASSFGVPSFSIFRPSCLPASSAPLKTHCQYSEVVAFTITATRSSACAAFAPIPAAAASVAASIDFHFIRPSLVAQRSSCVRRLAIAGHVLNKGLLVRLSCLGY